MQTKYLVLIVNSTTAWTDKYAKFQAEVEQTSDVKRVDVGLNLTPAEQVKAFCAEDGRPADVLIFGISPQLSAEFYRLYLAAYKAYWAKKGEAPLRCPIVIRHGRGVNNVDPEAAKAAGVPVFAVPGAKECNGVAEMALALTLGLLRGIYPGGLAMERRLWNHRALLHGPELNHADTTLGIVGCGDIGMAFRALVKRARVLGTDPVVAPATMRNADIEPVDLAALLAQSDVVLLSASKLEGFPLKLTLADFQQMKPTARMVNISRGSHVAEKDVVKALRARKLAGYATDVYIIEPPFFVRKPRQPASPLVTYYRQWRRSFLAWRKGQPEESVLPTIELVPHLGGYSDTCKEAMATVVRDVTLSAVSTGPIQWQYSVNGINAANWANLFAA